MPILLDVLIALSFQDIPIILRKKDPFSEESPLKGLCIHSLGKEFYRMRANAYWKEKCLVHLKYRVCLVKRVCCLPLFYAYNSKLYQVLTQIKMFE